MAFKVGSSAYKKHLGRNSGGFSTSDTEVRDLVKSWFVISLAFALVMRNNGSIFTLFVLSSLSVGVGFILHELAHKIVAQYYRCHAEFRANNQMLMIALLTSFFGFIFAAPGAVMIRGHASVKKIGHIAIAGPITNFVLAVLFLMLPGGGFLGALGSHGFMINVWLGLFNMIPLAGLDGKKVLAWNKVAFGVTLACGIILFQIPYLV